MFSYSGFKDGGSTCTGIRQLVNAVLCFTEWFHTICRIKCLLFLVCYHSCYPTKFFFKKEHSVKFYLESEIFLLMHQDSGVGPKLYRIGGCLACLCLCASTVAND